MPKTNTCNISHFQLAKYYSYFTIFLSNSTLISQVLFNCNKLNRDNYLPDNPLNLRSSLFQLELIISTLQSSGAINWLSPFIVFKMSISHWFLSKKRGMYKTTGGQWLLVMRSWLQSSRERMKIWGMFYTVEYFCEGPNTQGTEPFCELSPCH